MVKTKNVNVTFVIEYESEEEIVAQYFLATKKLLETLEQEYFKSLKKKEDSNYRVRMSHFNT